MERVEIMTNYEVDDFRFSNRKGKCGFYRYDNEWEYLESFCDY